MKKVISMLPFVGTGRMTKLTRLALALSLVGGVTASAVTAVLLDASPAAAAVATYTCTTPATGSTATTFYTGVTNTYAVACYGISGVSAVTAYPASLTLATGTPISGSTQGTTTTDTPPCVQSTSGSGTSEKYILTCTLTDNPTTSQTGSYGPYSWTANPGTDGGTAVTSGSVTVTVSNTTQACIAPASAGTATTFDEGYTNSFSVQCENETHVSGQAQYPSSIAITSGTGPVDAPVTFATSTSSSPACTQSTSGSGTTEQYILTCALSFAPTTADAGAYPFTFTPTANSVAGPTSGTLTVNVAPETLTCTAPAAAGTNTTFNSSAGGTANSFAVACYGTGSTTATYPTSITANGTLPADLVEPTSTSSTPACVRSTSGSGTTEHWILTCTLTENAVSADNGVYTSTFTASDSNNGATTTSGLWTLTVTGPNDVCTSPAAAGTSTTFRAGVANTFSVACYGTGFASASAGNYPSSITLTTPGSLPADVTEATSTSSTPACTTSTSGSGLTEQYILTCAVTETPTAADEGNYPVTFSETPGVNGGTAVTSGTWNLTVAPVTMTCIDPAVAGSSTTFYENTSNSYTVECEAQSGISGTAAYPTSIAIASGALPGDTGQTFATSTGSTPACTHATSGSGATEQYILECALAGTPTSSDAGSYPFTFTATAPDGVDVFTSGTLTVTIQPPTTTCSAPAAAGTTTSFTDGTAGSYSVTCASQGYGTAQNSNYPTSITLNTGTLPADAHEATSTSSTPVCTHATSGSGVTELYELVCPVTQTPTSADNGSYPVTFFAAGGLGAGSVVSGTWTLKDVQPAPSWATSGSNDGNYDSVIKGVPFCYDIEVSAGQVGPTGTNGGSAGSLPLTSLTAGTTPANVSNYAIQDVNLAAGTAQLCGTNNNTVASSPVIMAPVATNTAGSATDSIPLWSQNECTWSSTGSGLTTQVSMFDPNQDLETAGSQSAFGQAITNGVQGGVSLDKPSCPGGVGVSASGGLGDAWTMNTANPLPTPTDTNPSAALGDLPSSNLDLTSATNGQTGGCYGATNILASTSTSSFGSAAASMVLPSTWVNGGNCAYGSLGSNSAGGNTDTQHLMNNGSSPATGDANCPPTQADVNAGLVSCTVILSSGNDENGSVNYSTLEILYNGQPVPQTPTASLSSGGVQAGDTVTVGGGANWFGSSDGAPNAGPYGDFQNGSGEMYPVSAPQVLIGTSRGTAVPVTNSTVTINTDSYACTGAESTSVGPNPCTLTVGQPTGTFQVPAGLAPGAYNVYIDESNTTPLPGNGPNDAYQTAQGTNLGTAESVTPIVVGPPVFNSAASTIFTETVPGTFGVSASGYGPVSLSASGLPSWLSLSDNGDGSGSGAQTDTGVLAGTPPYGSSFNSPFNFTITATDGNGNTTVQNFVLTVSPTAAVFTSSATTTFTENAFGTFPVTASGDAPITFATSGLPSGVTLSSSGTLSGTPAFGTAADSPYDVTIVATDGHGATTGQSFTLNVNEGNPVITSAGTTTFEQNTFGTIVAATAVGDNPITFTETGTLPQGVTLASDGTLSGTPVVVSGQFPISITATDVNGNTSSAPFTLYVHPAGNVYVATTSLPNGKLGVHYSQTLEALGGTPGYHWKLLKADGKLPTGLKLKGSGRIVGIPTKAGTSSFTVEVLDSSKPKETATATFTVTVS
jgi:hypothetical protein